MLHKIGTRGYNKGTRMIAVIGGRIRMVFEQQIQTTAPKNIEKGTKWRSVLAPIIPRGTRFKAVIFLLQVPSFVYVLWQAMMGHGKILNLCLEM